MTVVFPPCLIDLCKAYLDCEPDFSEEFMRDWREDVIELFDTKWETVELLLEELHNMGITYLDAKPGNIRFPS